MADDVKKPEDGKTDIKNQTPANETPKDSKIAEEKPKEEKPPEAQKRSSRPPKTDKADKPTKEKTGKDASGGKSSKPTVAEKPKSATEKSEPEAPPPPPEPTAAPRTGEQEQIVYINLSEIRPFKDHPFQVKMDAAMVAMVESVKDKGVTQPAILRPHADGGYEMVSGHRRHLASELSNYTNMPCIVRDLTDHYAPKEAQTKHINTILGKRSRAGYYL
jgi:hypothetical protein